MPTNEDANEAAADDLSFTSKGTATLAPLQSSDKKRVYYFTQELYGIASLAMQRLKVTRFHDANDPYELRALRVPDKRTLNLVRKQREQETEKHGMICFSAEFSDPVMWSHYADRHRGMCLAFEVDASKLLKVEYAAERVMAMLDNVTDEGLEALDPSSQDLMRRSKFVNWQYEKEVRWIIPLEQTIAEAGKHFYPMGDDLDLRGVFIGERCGLNQDAIIRLVGALFPRASVWKARLNLKTFGVNEGERLWPSSAPP